MITAKQAMENPELMIKHKASLKDEEIFEEPWCDVFQKYPYLYREFSDRFDEMDGMDIACALGDDPTLVLDLKNHLHKMSEEHLNWVLYPHPKLSLCMKYREYPDKAEAAYYITFPHELDNLNDEEKREMSKKIMELLGEEKA
jgi:tRNA-dihydrouridine synthase